MSGSQERQRPRLRALPPSLIAGLVVAGLVIGYLLRRIFEAVDRVPPAISWIQVAAPFLAAAILALAGRGTWRAVRSRVAPLDFQQAVNRLALARACALVAALIAGGYGGYAVSWLWIDVDAARLLALKSAVGAAGGLVMLAAALFLQAACKVKSDGPDDLDE